VQLTLEQSVALISKCLDTEIWQQQTGMLGSSCLTPCSPKGVNLNLEP
jgi:hypothetical protein